MSTTRTITLTGRPPIRITEESWPIIASAKDWDNTYECQANRTWRLTVRQHADGRAIIYGAHATQWVGESGRRGGVYCDSPDTTTQDIVDAIQMVGESLDFSDQLIAECLADMPAEEV